MPRYFVTTCNHVVAPDSEGTVLPDIKALRDLLRRTLIEILGDEGARTGVDEFTAEATDERGRRVLLARISYSVTDQ